MTAIRAFTRGPDYSSILNSSALYQAIAVSYSPSPHSLAHIRTLALYTHLYTQQTSISINGSVSEVQLGTMTHLMIIFPNRMNEHSIYKRSIILNTLL